MERDTPHLPPYSELETKVLTNYNEHRAVKGGKVPPAGDLGDIPFECLKRIMNKLCKDVFDPEQCKDKADKEMLVKAQGNFKRELQRRWKAMTKLPVEAECIPSEVVETFVPPPVEEEEDPEIHYKVSLHNRMARLEAVVFELIISQCCSLVAIAVLALVLLYLH
jgi:hypothetical protein